MDRNPAMIEEEKRLSSLRELSLWAPLMLTFFILADEASWFWTNIPEMQFGWMIPILGGYLLFEAWERRSAVVARWTRSSALLIGVGCGALFVTQIYQAAYGVTASSLTGAGVAFLAVSLGNILYLYGGRGARNFGFGVCFMMLAVPIPPMINSAIIGGLQEFVAMVTVETLALLGVPAELQGSLVRLPTGVLGVNEACSGIRSLQSTVMATLFIGHLVLRLKSTQVLLFISGVSLAILGNLTRVFFLSYSASKYGLEAVDTAHDAAGWTILLATVIGVGLLSWVLGKVESSLISLKRAG